MLVTARRIARSTYARRWSHSLHAFGKAIHAAQLREPPRPGRCDEHGRDTAEHDGAHRAEPCGRDARTRTRQLVRRADEHGVHGADAAADRRRASRAAPAGGASRRSPCRRRRAVRARSRQTTKLVDRPNTTVATPNTPTPANSHRPTCRSSGERPARARTLRRRCRARCAARRARRSRVQDVARVDRQQRGRAAEQHREQIERDRAEHAGFERTNVRPESSERNVTAGGVVASPAADAHSHHEHRRDGEQCGHGAEHDARDPRDSSRPPSVGPTIVQTWNTVELTAVALANSSGSHQVGHQRLCRPASRTRASRRITSSRRTRTDARACRAARTRSRQTALPC